MFDIGSTELLLIIIVAIVVIGPKDLPHALFKVGQVVGKAKGMARHFRTGLDAMMREAELAELEKKWAEENRRIMAASAAPPLPDLPSVEGALDLADTPATSLAKPAQADADSPAVLANDGAVQPAPTADTPQKGTAA